MRHTILCVLIALLAAIFSLVLIPIVVLLLLRILIPRIFDDDTLIWMLVFAGPGALALLVTLAIIIGVVAFFLSSARLPNRGWRSAQTFVIPLALFTTVLAIAALAWPFYAQPPEAGPQQTGLPSLHLVRTLSATGKWPGTSQLAWSADGERLAAYGGAGIATWSPDGKYQKELAVHQHYPSLNVLRYLSGHSQLITSPVASVNSSEERERLADVALSVVDAETGKVIQNIPGPRPGGREPMNSATDLAVSPNERLIAVICGHVERQINVYSTNDWKQVATVDLHTGEKGDTLPPYGLAFSPDGKTLAVIHGSNGRIEFFNVESWAFSGSFVTYPDPLPPKDVLVLQALAFSPDGTMIAVGSGGGGSWWSYPAGMIALPGSGAFKQEFPADPLRVFRISDGVRVASLGSFPGGLHAAGLVWSPKGDYLAFQDGLGDIRFWNPFQPKLSIAVARKGVHYSNLLFSRDSLQLAASFPDGVKVFDVVPPRAGGY
jgi:WD40 repeat protein